MQLGKESTNEQVRAALKISMLFIYHKRNDITTFFTYFIFKFTIGFMRLTLSPYRICMCIISHIRNHCGIVPWLLQAASLRCRISENDKSRVGD
jgi:hypothetical protein